MMHLSHSQQSIVLRGVRRALTLPNLPLRRFHLGRDKHGLLLGRMHSTTALAIGCYAVGNSLSARLPPTLCETASEQTLIPSQQRTLLIHNKKLASSGILYRIRRAWRMLLRFLKLTLIMTPVAALYPLIYLLPQAKSQNESADAQDIMLSSGDESVDDNSYSSLLRRWYYELCLSCVENSGAAVVKLMQWAGSRPDLFGHEFCSVFSRLQDNTKPHSWFYTDQAMRKAYGDHWSKKIELGEILGSGCIGQVYRGKILNGQAEDVNRQVAVKVLHPAVEEGIEADLDLMRAAVYALTLLQGGTTWMDWSGLVEEFAHLLRWQLDLHNEARNLERFSKNFKGWKGRVEFPRVIPEFPPSKEVLVESFLDGVPVLQFARENRDNRKELHELCIVGIEAMCKMIFLDNFVHGDLHPGNVFISRDGKQFILLDVGIVTEFSEEDHNAIVNILAAMIRREGRRAGELMIDETHRRNITVLDEESFLQKMDALTKHAAAKDNYLMQQLGIYITYICDAAAKHHIRVLPSFISMALTIKVQEGIALALDPSIPIIKVATPLIVQSESRRKIITTWEKLNSWFESTAFGVNEKSDTKDTEIKGNDV